MFHGILLGLGTAFCYGSADVFATIVSRRLGILTTLFLSHLLSLPFMFIFLAFAWRQLALTPQAFLQSLPLGLVLGLLVTIGYFAFYRGLELGPLAIVSPITSIDGAITVLLAVLIFHESLDIFKIMALIILFLGIVFVSLEGTSPLAFLHTLRMHSFAKGGTRWALIAMIAFSFGLFGIGIATKTMNWFLPIFWLRIFSTLAITSVRLWQHTRSRSDMLPTTYTGDEGQNSWPLNIALATLIGTLDSGALLLYSFNTQVATTGIAAAVGSCFVLFPLFFGVIVLHERLAKHQLLGIGLVLSGLILLG